MKTRMGIMTDFSIGQSLLTIPRLLETSKSLGLEKVIIADDMTISSLIGVQNAFKGSDIEAMVGVKFRCYKNPTYRKTPGLPAEPNPYFAVKIFPKDEIGLKSIFKVLSRANTEERFYYNARGCAEDLYDLRNCILTTGDLFGVTDTDFFCELSDERKLDPSCDWYIELCPINNPFWDRVNFERMLISDYLIFKGVVLSYPAMYQTLDQADSMTPLKAVCTNTAINSGFLPHQAVRNLALDNGVDLMAEFDAMVERCKARFANALAIDFEELKAKILKDDFNKEPYYKFEYHAPCLPRMAEDEFKTLVDKCKKGWAERLFTERLGYKPDASLLPVYKNRLAYELSVLKSMGFSGYFLVVEDLVNWSKTHGVRVGCGRGSGGGSLVAYLLGITEVDPIRFNLIFERFINPSRLDLPDIDLDYQSSKRNLVIEYLKEKYGEDRVAGISNYGTLASASAFRDTGRIFGLTPLQMTATKLVPKENGISATLTEAADQVPEIDKLKADYPEVWKHALRFEGVMRSLGQHAAGTVVAGEPIVERAVVERRAEGNVVNWDKRVVEDCGLIKMDILGLSTLDVLDIAQAYIKKRHGIEVDYLKLPLGEPDVMEAFGQGATTAVFQFDSKGMQDLLRRLAKGGALTFDDITAATALYRPGPLDSGLTEDYVAIKQGMKAPHYDHPAMKDALKSTYGVMVYQEQIMQVSRDLCGFTMAEADLLRKATAKKDAKKMASLKDKFIQGAENVSHMDAFKAEALWDKIEKFAAYSFNLSHSVAYTILSYWTCWLKVRYPAEYFAAQLSIVREDKYASLVKDARSCGIDVVPPDINISTDKFEIKDERTIVMPFSSVKGCSETIAKKIIAAREKVGHFVTKMHFEEIASQKGSGINVRVVNHLDLVGAFASIEPSQPAATSELRRKDQVTLLSGLIIDTIVSTNVTTMDKAKKYEILAIHNNVLECQECDLHKKPHPLPTVGGAKCRFMVVFDNPSAEEEEKGKMFVGKGASFMKQAMKDNGVSPALGYYTSLVRAKKDGKFLSNQQINGCSKYLDNEVKLVNAGVIVCMGSSAVRHFLPSIKSPASEVGNAYYVKEIDSTVIIGLNPIQILFDPSKTLLLDSVVKKLAEVISC